MRESLIPGQFDWNLTEFMENIFSHRGQNCPENTWENQSSGGVVQDSIYDVTA